MTNEAGLVESPRYIFECDCEQSLTDICLQISKYFFGFLRLATLAISIVAIILATREDKSLRQTNNDLSSVRKEIEICFKDSKERIEELASEIDQIEESLKDLIQNTKSTLEDKINSVESWLNARMISMQNQVSYLNTNVDHMGTSLGSYEYSTNKDFSQVWVKFNEVDKKIANLQKNRGNSVDLQMHHCVLFCSVIVLLFNVG